MDPQVVAALKAFENGRVPPVFAILPWQLPAWHQVVQARLEGRLSHAYIIGGVSGLGKLRFAYHIAQSLLCVAPTKDHKPCGCCRGCHLFSVGNHPDLRLVTPDPESKAKEIKVEAIRDLLEINALSAHSGGNKIIIIAPAEGMNRQAANSLLKTLEEPTANTFLFLVTSKQGRLLPTIRSRCQLLPILAPPEAEALNWLTTQVSGHNHKLALRLAQGAPLAALKFLDADVLTQRREAVEAFFGLIIGKGNALAIAESWMQQDLPQLLTWLSSWVADVLRLQTQACNVYLDNQDLADILARYGANINPAVLHRMWAKIVEVRWQLRTNLDPLLLIETLLIYWSEMKL